MEKDIIGAIYALITALSWAGGHAVIKFLSVKIDALSLNTIRLCFSSLCLLAFIPISGRGADLIHTPLLPLIFIMASGVAELSIGDTIYIKSLAFLDVSQAYPIAQCSYPIFTVLLAILFLNESFTWTTGLGACLVVTGIYLMAGKGKRSTADSISGRSSGKGVALAITGALGWAIGAALLKKGVIGIDPFVVAAIRIPAGAMLLLLFALTQRKRGALQFKKYGSRGVVLATVAGFFSGLGQVFFIMAIPLIGAGKTVLLVSVSPLFILPLSVLILKEKITPYTLAGIFTCLAGVYMVIA